MNFLWCSHKAFLFRNENKFFFRGSVYYRGILYERENAEKLYDKLKVLSRKEIVQSVQTFNGNFIFGIKWQEDWLIFQDKIMSFPLYWTDDGKYISDSIKKLQGKHDFDDDGLFEIASFKYTLGNKTLYKGINALCAGEWLEIITGSQCVNKHIYYRPIHKEDYLYDVEQYIDELKNVIDKTFNRLVKRLAGRQAVLFLSGGYDSRLICQQLSKRNYKNVLCVSLRSSNDLDVQVSKEIADFFGYKLVTVEYNSNYWRERAKKESFWEMIDDISNGVVFPYYMQGLVIEDLIKEGVISADAVIMTGNSGDVVEGNDVFEVPSFAQMFSRKEIKNKIIDTHCQNIYSSQGARDRIYKHLDSLFGNSEIDNFTCAEAQDIYELFNWYNRQCKYVTSDVRNYDDVTGNEWALPLWDDEFVEFWLNVPFELRYKRKLYYMYVKKDNLPTANIDTLFLKVRRLFFRYFSWMWKHLYSIRIFWGFVGNSIAYSWAGMLSLKDKISFIYAIRGNRTSAMSAVMWKMFRKKYKMDIFRYVK